MAVLTDNAKEFCKKYLINKKVKYYYQKEYREEYCKKSWNKKKSKEIIFVSLTMMMSGKKINWKSRIDFFNNCKDKNIGLLTTWMELINKDNKIIGYKQRYEEGNVYKKIFMII